MINGVGIKSSTSSYKPDVEPTLGNTPIQQPSSAMSLFPRNTAVQFRNTNVGMFSGPRPSYQRYSTNLASAGVLNRTGV
jgi:hypothetical protein